MAIVVLILHLVICVGLVALVLLQRSEGGALGVGGGGGGALMSGRGAADALAKMTSVAGGVFLVTSLALTLIQGAAQTSSHRSVFDSLPSAPAIHLPNFGGSDEKAVPEQQQQTPARDPLESAAPAQTQTASAPISIAPSAASASERAGPVASTPAPPPAATAPRPAAASTTAAAPHSTTTTTAAARPASATTTATRPATRPAASNTSGVASNVTVPTETADDPLTAVRRDSRAGPDQ